MKEWLIKIVVRVIGALAFFGIFKLFMQHNTFENVVLLALSLCIIFVLTIYNNNL